MNNSGTGSSMENPSYSSVLLGFGSNLGDKCKYIDNAIARLSERNIIYDIVNSSYFESEPVGFSDQPWFINSVVSAKSELSPVDLLASIKSIENETGRVKRDRWQEREIDIDILLIDNIILNSGSLVIPHPEMHKRRFVLQPAAEIAPMMIHPQFNLTIQELLQKCNDLSIVKKY